MVQVLESGRFDSAEGLRSELRELKLAGMRELGLPESLVNNTRISFDALELRAVLADGMRKVPTDSYDEMEKFVDAHAGEFVLSVRI